LVLVPRANGFGVAVDLAGRSFGRGAWVHGRPACLDRAVARGLARSAKGRVEVHQQTLAADIVTAAQRRVEGLVASAARRGQLAVGASAVRNAWSRGRAKLLVVARDAAAAAALGEVRAAEAAGRLTIGPSKKDLGALAMQGGGCVGVMGIESESIASALRPLFALMESFGSSAVDADEPQGATGPCRSNK